MKKINFLVAYIFAVSFVFAQDGLVNKNGETILPKKGDWAIGIDASPLLKYVGNFIGGNGINAAPTFNFLSSNQAILGKYFIDDSKAYRVGLRLGLGSNSTTTKVSTIPSTTPTAYVDNVSTVSGSNIGLTAGMEWRKGKTRLQGYYGGEAGIALGSTMTTNKYGNIISSSNPVSRTIENNSGGTFGIGARAFVGAEYFVLPKISIGGEFGWGITLATIGEGSLKTEYWNGTAIKSSTTPTGGSTVFGFDSDNLSSIFGAAGTIHLTLHF